MRIAVNLLNGSTLAGIGAAFAGRAKLVAGPDGLLIAEGYRLRLPATQTFCLGSVIVTRLDRDTLVRTEPLLAHEARHATQYAWCAGLVMLPLYCTAAGLSWVVTGDFYSWNIYERLAGLAEGGYTDRPLRPAIAQSASSFAEKFRRRLSARRT